MSSPPRIGRMLIPLALSFALIPKSENAAPVKGICEGRSRAQASKPKEVRPEFENLPIIKENTVVFLSLSKDDYDALVKKAPSIKDELPDVLSDFYFYSNKVAEKLKALGIATEFGQWKELSFQMPAGKIEKRTFSPEDVFGLALYAQGKLPLMVRSEGSREAAVGEERITADFFSIARVISEYFGIKMDY